MVDARGEPDPEGADDEQPIAGKRISFDSALAMLQTTLADVCAGAASVCVTDYEASDDAVVSSVVDRAKALLSSALEALDVAAVLYGDIEEPVDLGEPTSSEADLSAPSSAPPPGLADAVVLARMGLRSRQRALRPAGPGTSRWEQLAAVDSALRTIQKSLSAVDRALSSAERVPSSLSFYEAAVDRSLAVRRRYVRLHRTAVQQGPPAPGELRARLRLVGNTIAQILGLDVAAHLRTGDRALLMMSHSRVRDWLSRLDDAPAHVAAGLRLWQDIVNVATMFLDVSKREELVQHDARLVRAALAELPSSGEPLDEQATSALLARLRTMLGRSPSLDVLLEAPAPPAPAELRRVLEDLDRALGASAA